MHSERIERALRAALAAHEGQWRKSREPVPYVIHPLHVALILARFEQDEDVIVAGLLHDVVEDCEAWTLERVAEEFGAHVASVVGELSEDKDKGWEERKRDGVARVAGMSPQAATIKAADKLHNLSTLHEELSSTPDVQALWAQFKGGRERTLSMARELVEALALRVEPKVARALRTALSQVEASDSQVSPARVGEPG